MSDLVGTPEDWFSHDAAHIQEDLKINLPFGDISAKKLFGEDEVDIIPSLEALPQQDVCIKRSL